VSRLPATSPAASVWLRRLATGALVLVLAVLIVPRLLTAAGVPQFVFAGCSDPQSIHVDSVDVSLGSVRLSGSTISSAMLYRGYVSQLRDGALTVGVRYGLTGNGTGSFSERIPTGDIKPSAVYLSDGATRRRIY